MIFLPVCGILAHSPPFAHNHQSLRLSEDALKDCQVGEDDEQKMKLVALEYRARLVLERFRKRDTN